MGSVDGITQEVEAGEQRATHGRSRSRGTCGRYKRRSEISKRQVKVLTHVVTQIVPDDTSDPRRGGHAGTEREVRVGKCRMNQEPRYTVSVIAKGPMFDQGKRWIVTGQGGNVVGYYETEDQARAEADKRNASDHQVAVDVGASLQSELAPSGPYLHGGDGAN